MEPYVQVLQSSLFRRTYKRLHSNQKADVDDAIAEIVRDPTIGEQKKGDLAGVFDRTDSVANCLEICHLLGPSSGGGEHGRSARSADGATL